MAEIKCSSEIIHTKIAQKVLTGVANYCCTGQYLERPKYKNCNESQNNEVNGVGSIPVWSGGINFEEIGQKQNGSF